jgi:hypothetical protein
LYLAEAARSGYHVIGLDYPTHSAFKTLCGDDLSCYGPAHLEDFDGMDHSPVLQTDPDNCIRNRIIKLLQYLITKYPAEGWAQYLSGGAPVWSRIVTSGHSQGGGHAGFIAQLYELARVVTFSSVDDANSATPPASALWVTQPFQTPAARFFGFAHTGDMTFYPGIRADWKTIGMDAFGAAVSVDSSAPPYNNTHELISSRAVSSPHNQIINDGTPLQNGVPVYRSAWRYLLGP